MINRILNLCDYAAYYRIDAGFFIIALVGSVMIALGNPHGWLVAGAFLALWICVAAFGDRSTHPVYNLNERVATELAKGFSLQRVAQEPLPPWLAEPSAEPLHMVWRMGGEHYIANFFRFFRDLGRDQQDAYFARYDLGPNWPHRRQWHQALFDPTDIESV